MEARYVIEGIKPVLITDLRLQNQARLMSFQSGTKLLNKKTIKKKLGKNPNELPETRYQTKERRNESNWRRKSGDVNERTGKVF